MNSLTSIYGGLVVFSILGFMATQSNVPLAEVVRSGITLTFVSFPAAIAQMPGSSLWSVVFFFMVLILGLDTQFTVVEICTTAIMDGFSQVCHFTTWKIIVFSVSDTVKTPTTGLCRTMLRLFPAGIAPNDRFWHLLGRFIG